MTGFLLGSETQRVLAQTKLPVLVLRASVQSRKYDAGMRTPPRRRRARARRAGASTSASTRKNPRCRPARPTSPASLPSRMRSSGCLICQP